MPRKSKAQKKRADRIKERHQTEKVNVTPNKTLEVAVKIKSEPTDPQEQQVAQATKQDLIKTLIIVASIFALEFAVFYATLK